MKFIRTVIVVILAVMLGFTVCTKDIPLIPRSGEVIQLALNDETSESAASQDIPDIHGLRFLGSTPYQKLAQLVTFMHNRYPRGLAIAGRYDQKRDLGTGLETNYVVYDINLDFTQRRTIDEYNEVEDQKNKILGELVVLTAELLSAETHIPNIGENILNEMTLYVETIHWTREQRETKEGELFIPGAYLQSEPERNGFVFDRDAIEGLLGEKDVMKWSAYPLPLPWMPSFPNTGPTEGNEASSSE